MMYLRIGKSHKNSSILFVNRVITCAEYYISIIVPLIALTPTYFGIVSP
jgi:hypothetical protein